MVSKRAMILNTELYCSMFQLQNGLKTEIEHFCVFGAQFFLQRSIFDRKQFTISWFGIETYSRVSTQNQKKNLQQKIINITFSLCFWAGDTYGTDNK